jgi:cyclophilin family peptidyl-prolyl cis-trans isomerase
VPTEKRARQKAARRKKRAAEVRRVKNRRRLRTGGFFTAGAAVVVVLVLLTTGVFSGSPPKKKSATGTTTTTTTTAPTTTTTTTASATQDAQLQAAANNLAVAAKCPATPKTRVNTKKWSAAPQMTIDTADSYTATVKTTAGTFAIALDAKTAPHTVNNFVFLADQDFYNCVIFHRVIPGFMDQTGDPTGTGTGGPGYEFANENVPTAYATGDVAMANSGGTDTNGSQFFIVVPGGATTLDSDLKAGDKYSLFGTVTSGLTVVEKINSEGAATGKPNVTQRVLSVSIHES